MLSVLWILEHMQITLSMQIVLFSRCRYSTKSQCASQTSTRRSTVQTSNSRSLQVVVESVKKCPIPNYSVLASLQVAETVRTGYLYYIFTRVTLCKTELNWSCIACRLA